MIKRKITLTFILTFILILGITFLSFHYGIEEKDITNDNLLSIMLEDEEGRYVKAKENTWSEEYILNEEKSYCTNNSKLSYNEETKKVSLTTKGSEKCWLYFDKEITGSEDNPYKIATIEDLVNLSNEVNKGNNYAGKYIVLTKDLDFKNREDYENPDRIDYGNINGVNGIETLYNELNNSNGSGFTPIGNNNNNTFQGIFEGKGYKISNLFINQNQSIAVGLFGAIKNSTIKNLTITGNVISQVTNIVGGPVGASLGKSTLENCHNEATITNNSGSNSAGGIVGNNYDNTSNLTITNCTNKGSINNGNNTGGIIGFNAGTLVVSNSINYGNIINNNGANTGGIIGASPGVTKIEKSHNEGLVSSDNNKIVNDIGGLAGATTNTFEIDDSYNIGNVTVNGEGGAHIGGLIGVAYKKAIINNSYNASNAIKISPNGFDTGNYIGGIVGFIYNQTEISILKNSYNSGEIVNGNRVGGLVGDLRSGAIIDKCYNTGNINVNDEIWSGTTIIGGLVGLSDGWAIHEEGDIILNSYNAGNIMASNKNSTYVSGLTINQFTNKLILLNSYNAGNISSQSNGSYYHRAVGIIYSTTRNNNSSENNINILNNVYSLGTISGSVSEKYSLGIFDLNTTTNDIKNTYSENSINASNVAGVGGTPMALNDMKSQAFVDTLNRNLITINLNNIDSNLSKYSLSFWQLGEDNIPTFASDFRDLSGNGNDGLNFGATLSEEGITTGENNYINCGLAGYDFKNSASLIVKVKISEFTTNDHQRMFNNYGPPGLLSGIGIAYAPDNSPNVSFRGVDSNSWNHLGVSNKLIINNWYTIVGTYDGNTEKIYVNGVTFGEKTYKDNIKVSNYPFLLGRSLMSDMDYTLATYAEALIFDRALTEEEVKNNYAGEINSVNKDNLVTIQTKSC